MPPNGQHGHFEWSSMAAWPRGLQAEWVAEHHPAPTPLPTGTPITPYLHRI